MIKTDKTRKKTISLISIIITFTILLVLLSGTPIACKTHDNWPVFEYGENKLDLQVQTVPSREATWVFYGDGEKLEEIKTNDVKFNWNDYGNFENKKFKIKAENYSDITKIRWVSSSIKGNIPPEIGNLTNLERIDLTKNNLTGEIPSQIDKLNNLKRIYLESNELTGEIPQEFENLSKINTISLHNNDLNGEIPSEIWQLTNLKHLTLSKNNLTGTIPSEIKNLTDLEWLWLSQNNLEGEIPSEIGNLTQLKHLNLSQNNLTGTIPPEIGNLTKLQRLYIESNELTGEIPPEIGNMTELKTMTFHKNNLTGKIPTEIGNLTKLQHLLLSKNNLTGTIPLEIQNLTNLRFLDLRFNNLTDYENGALSTQPQLGDINSDYNVLNLSNNNLTSEDVDKVISDLYKSLELENRVQAEVLLENTAETTSESKGELQALKDSGFEITGDVYDDTPDTPNSQRTISTLWIIGLVIAIAILIFAYLKFYGE